MYIFGCGKYSKYVKAFLERNHVSVIGFVTSSTIDEIGCGDIVVIGVGKGLEHEIKPVLEQKKCEYYAPLWVDVYDGLFEK